MLKKVCSIATDKKLRVTLSEVSEEGVGSRDSPWSTSDPIQCCWAWGVHGHVTYGSFEGMWLLDLVFLITHSEISLHSQTLSAVGPTTMCLQSCGNECRIYWVLGAATKGCSLGLTVLVCEGGERCWILVSYETSSSFPNSDGLMLFSPSIQL